MINGKRYVGQAQNIEKRLKDHFRKSSNPHLRNSLEKYGEDNFETSILEKVIDLAKLDEREQYWIDSYLWDELYNIAPFAGSVRGVERSPDSVKKTQIGILKGWGKDPSGVDLTLSGGYDILRSCRMKICHLCGYEKYTWQFSTKEFDGPEKWIRKDICRECTAISEEIEQELDESLKGVTIPQYEKPVFRYYDPNFKAPISL